MITYITVNKMRINFTIVSYIEKCKLIKSHTDTHAGRHKHTQSKA